MRTDFDRMFDSPFDVHTPIVKEQYTITQGHIVQWGVLAIRPHWKEAQKVEIQNPATSIDEAVPWHAGVVMDLIALQTIDHRGIVRSMYSETGDGGVTLPFWPNYLSIRTKLEKREVESGWAREYSEEGRILRYEFPQGWNEMEPARRRDYWITMLGGRFGFQRGGLAPGRTFSAFFTRNKSKTTGKWYQDAKMSYQDESGHWHSDCPVILGAVDLSLLQKINAKCDELYGLRASQCDTSAMSSSVSIHKLMDDPNIGF
ncbi:MAG: hypothetical protein M5R41_19185 [Bacteroidia bacterium]|nr:hypothetical protein [Bacteroidia bacterium]